MIFDLIYFFNIVFSFIIGFYLLFRLNPLYEKLHVTSLAWYFILNAFCFSFYLLIKYEYILYVPYLYKFPAPITYLVAPMMYFHIRFISNNQVKITKFDLLHFVPFVVFTFSYLGFYTMDFSEKKNYVLLVIEDFNLSFTDSVGLIPEYINSIGRVLHPFFYLILQWIIIYKHRAQLSNQNKQKLFKWVFRFTILQSLYLVSLFFTVLLVMFYPEIYDKFIFSDIPAILTIFFFFTISIYLFWNQEILAKLKNFHPKNEIHASPLQKSFNDISIQVVQNEYFTDQELSLHKLSILLDINYKELSFIISNQNLNYNSWLNGLRIEYSMQLIKDGFLDRYSVDALAKKSGFNSKNTFYRSFKKITEVTPVKFHESNKPSSI